MSLHLDKSKPGFEDYQEQSQNGFIQNKQFEISLLEKDNPQGQKLPKVNK